MDYIYIYIQPFSKTFSYGEIYRYIYILLFSCTCARVHFSLVIVQLVKKLGSTINFVFVGFFVPIWKEHVVLRFYFLEKCMRPEIKIFNDELYTSWFWEWEKHPAKQPSYMGSPNSRPNAISSVASEEAFLLMECIKKCAVQGRALKKNCKLTWKHLWPRVYSVFSETLPYTCRDFKWKKNETLIYMISSSWLW